MKSTDLSTEVVRTPLGDVEYSTYGDGLPVLFVHGGHSNARELLTHKHLDPAMYTLVTPSRPGYGKTPLASFQSPEKTAHLLHGLMDLLGHEHYAVIGISAGGPTAIYLAALYPSRVSRLVLASAVTKRWLTPDQKLYRQAQRMFHPGRERFIWTMMRLFLKLSPGLIYQSLASELTSEKVKPITSEEKRDLNGMLGEQASGEGFLTDLEHDTDPAILGKIETPTMIVHSRNDSSVPREHPLHAAELIDESKMEWVENKWGHLLWVGAESRQIVAKISAFLQAGGEVKNS